MQPSDFTKPSGDLVKSLGGAWAFVPHPLPPSILWGPALVASLTRASQYLGELSGAGGRLINPQLLIRPFVNREAVLSSRIEGTQSGLSQLALFQVEKAAAHSGTHDDQDADAREVDNYRRALDYGLASKLPLSLRLLREMHEILMEHGRKEAHVTPGEFRKGQNWIGATGCRIDEATYVPPPPERMTEALKQLEGFLHAESDLPPLVRIALSHYQFEAIHPFEDGNGRIGRLLIVLLLSRWGLMPQPLLYLSAFFERRRDAYYRHLREVSQASTWNEWLLFFLQGVETEARDAARRSVNLLELRDRMRQRFAKGSARVLQLIDRLFIVPATTIPFVASDLKVTYRAADLIVRKLVEAGYLEEREPTDGYGRARWFFASEILKTLEEPLPVEL